MKKYTISKSTKTCFWRGVSWYFVHFSTKLILRYLSHDHTFISTICHYGTRADWWKKRFYSIVTNLRIIVVYVIQKTMITDWKTKRMTWSEFFKFHTPVDEIKKDANINCTSNCSIFMVTIHGCSFWNEQLLLPKHEFKTMSRKTWNTIKHAYSVYTLLL